MDAMSSEAYVSEVLEIYQKTPILVIGHDRYGNYVDRDGGQASRLRVRVTPQCHGVPPQGHV